MYVASVHELNYDIYVDFKFTKLALIMSNKMFLTRPGVDKVKP